MFEAWVLKITGALITIFATVWGGIVLKNLSDSKKIKRAEEKRKRLRQVKATVLLDMKMDAVVAELEARHPGFQNAYEIRFERAKAEYDWLNDIHVESNI